MEEIVPIIKEHTQPITCSNCEQVSYYYVLANMWPHLYCSRCNNVYHETIDQRNYSKIITNWGRHKAMNLIESQAPLCECGGLFLFNAQPNCNNCNNPLPLIYHEPISKKRLHHDALIVFDGTKEYLSQGHTRKYKFK